MNKLNKTIVVAGTLLTLTEAPTFTQIINKHKIESNPDLPIEQIVFTLDHQGQSGHVSSIFTGNFSRS